MPSFLSKVFGRKKDDKESPRRVEDTGLLDGKFEAVSPSATKFPEVANERQPRYREKDSPFNVFRSKSRPSSPEPKDKRAQVPHLSLNLPGLKNEDASRELGVVFEADLDSQLLSEEAIGSRRLSPLETLILVRACSEAIIARGLETLGVMHPHWYSASPVEQRKLISLFLRSLNAKASITTLSPSPSAIATAFDSEISSTQSPYDVAAVLRWGLRHLQLDETSFGKDGEWYKTFFDAERSAGWPPNGYSTTLAPLLPASHLELLTATLELFSSLAAHAEANGISGSKLSKFFGLWLLAVERAQDDDDWSTFYARWERTGRMLEHLFLARIRDDATASRMPIRLMELVQRYPYQTDPNADLLARPRFSTIQYDALFVRIETELSSTAQPSHHPLRILSEAFGAESSPDNDDLTALWESIRKAGAKGGSSSPDEYPGLSHVFADETLRFFSLVPVETATNTIGSPSFNLYTRPSSSDKDVTATAPAATTSSSVLKHSKSLASPITSSDVNSPVGPDWITFSTSGFSDDLAERPPLASTLLEKERDMEVTIPRPSSPRLILFNGRKSSDRPRTPAKAEEPSQSAILSPMKTLSKSTHVSLVQLDEAFIDFWSDALLDPISSSWPAFIICKLKNTETKVDGKCIEWLVLEQAFKRPPPPPPLPLPEASSSSHSHESSRHTNTSSPISSKSDASFMFGTMFKRLGFFTSPRKMTTPLPEDKEGAKVKGKRKEVVRPKIGEMGEILREEREVDGKAKEVETEKDEIVRVRVPSPKPKKSVDTSRHPVDAAIKKGVDGMNRTNGVVVGSLAAGAVAVVGGAAVAVADGASDQPEVVKAEEPVSAPAMNDVLADNAISTVLPQGEVPVPEPIKEAIPIKETIKGSPAAQVDEVPTSVAGAVEPKHLLETDPVKSDAAGRPSFEVYEPEVTQPAVGETKAAHQEVPVEEAKSVVHDAEPTAEGIRVLEPKVVLVVEDAKVAGYEAAPVVEEVKCTEPEVVPAAEETRVLLPQAVPVFEEAKVLEPEVVPAVEDVKAADKPEVFHVVEEARAPEPEIAPIIEKIEVHGSKAASVIVEDTKVLQPAEENEVPARIADEAQIIEPKVASVIEEAKIPEPETAFKTSIEEVPAVVPDIEGKSTSVVETVAEEPVKATVQDEGEMPPMVAEIATATIIEVVTSPSKEIPEESATVGPVSEDVLHQAAAEVASVVEKPVGPALAVSGNSVVKEESALIEPEVNKEETSSDGAIEVVQMSQQEPAIKETVAPGSEPFILESSDVGPIRELVIKAAGGEHAPVVGEPVVDIAENVPVVEPKQVAPPAVEDVVAGESAPVMEIQSPVKGEVALAREDYSPVVEGSEAEPSALIEAKSISSTLDGTAVIKPGNVVTKKITPVTEESVPSTTEFKNVLEATEQISASSKLEMETLTSSAEEHTVSVAEAEHKSEVVIHAPVEPVPADAPQEINILGLEGSAGVHAPIKEIAPAVEESTLTTVEPKAEVVAVPAEPESTPIAPEPRSDAVDSKEALLPTDEGQPVATGSTPSTSEHETSAPTKETIAGVKEPTASAAADPEPEVKPLEVEPASITSSQTAEDSIVVVKESLSAVVEPAPSVVDQATEDIDAVEPKEEPLALLREEAVPISVQSTFVTEPQAMAAATEAESPTTSVDEPVKKSAAAVENTSALATEEIADIVKESEPEVQVPAEAISFTTGHPAEDAEIVNTALTEVVSAKSEVKSTSDEVHLTLVATEASTGETMVTADHTEKTFVNVREASVAEDPVPASVVEPEPKLVETRRAPTVADQPAEEITVVGNSIKTPAPTEVVPTVEEPAPSVATEPKSEPEVPAFVEVEPSPIADEPVERSPKAIIEPSTIPQSEKDVSVPIVEVLAPSAVVESARVPTTVELQPASITADQPAESTVVVVSTSQLSVPIDAAPVVEESVQPQIEVHPPVEAKSVPTAEDESNEGTIPATRAAGEVTAPVTKEPVVEEQISSSGEPEPQAEVSAHTDTGPTRTAVEGNVLITDSNEDVPPLKVEESVPAVEETIPTAPEHEAERKEAPELAQPEPTPSTPDEPVEEEPAVVVGSTRETLAPTSEAVLKPVSSAQDEAVAPVPTLIAGESMKETFPIEIEPTEAPILAPTTEAPSLLVENAKLSAAGPEHEVEIHAPVEPVPAVAEEYVDKAYASAAEVSADEVPIVKKDTVSVEATIGEEKHTEIKVASVVEDTTEISAEGTTNGVALKDDVVMITENGSGHSAAVKEEEPTKTTVPADVHDTNVTTSAKE